MTLWKEHTEFTPEFLTQHRDLILYDALHHIKAFLLFPLNCSCEDGCRCSEQREKIILALNTSLYNEACKTGEADRIYAMKLLWRIPDDRFFREHYPEAYPIQNIKEKLLEQKERLDVISQLVWILLRLGKTMKYFGSAEVSINGAVKVLHATFKNTEGDELECNKRPWGKKKCAKEFKRYESVCHFIAALKVWEGDVQNKGKTFDSLDFSLAEIEKILKVSHWFRKKLLSLTRRNVINNIFLLEENLCPLPLWVHSDEIEFPIEPYEERIKEILDKAVIVYPQEISYEDDLE